VPLAGDGHSIVLFFAFAFAGIQPHLFSFEKNIDFIETFMEE